MDHDHPYKELFAQPELVADLLRLADLADGLDLDSLDRRNGSYVSEDWRDREDDVIWRVRWGDRDLYVYLLIEFQSTVDPLMTVRVMTYISLLWQDLARAGALNSDGSLPPILPLVLYNGEAPWTAPRTLHQAIGPVPLLMQPYQPEVSFLLLDEVRMGLREPPERNLASVVFSLERTGSPAEHVAIARMVAAWLRGPGKERILAAFHRWWTRTLRVRHSLPPDLNPFAEDPMLTTRIEQWTAQVEARGEARGEAKASIQTIVELALAGDLSRETAALRLRHLAEQGIVTQEQVDGAIARLAR